ncbi:MAG: hypothetical protein D6778_06750, partial [Nitrospirae bacterium]
IFRRISAAYGDINRMKLPPSRWNMLYEAALDSEIIDRLLLRAALKEGLTVPEEKINQDIEKLIKQMGREGFERMLKNRNATLEEFKEFLKKRYLIESYRDRLFSDISITEEEMKTYYQGHKTELAEPEKVKLDVFAVKDSELAEKIYRQWKDGSDFMKLKEKYERDPRKRIAWRLRWMPVHALPLELQSPVKKAKNSEVLKPVKAKDMYYVIKIKGYKPSQTPSFEEAKEKIRSILRARKEQKIIDSWYQEQLKTVKVEYVRD